LLHEYYIGHDGIIKNILTITTKECISDYPLLYIDYSVMCFSNAVKFTHEGKVGINLYVVSEPPFAKAEGHQKMTIEQSTNSAQGVKEEKNCLVGQKHNDHPSQNHSFNDECRTSVKSECSMNGDTEEQTHSTETTVWIRCDVYDTGIGIPGT